MLLSSSSSCALDITWSPGLDNQNKCVPGVCTLPDDLIFFWQFLRLVCVGFHYMYTQCIYNNYIYTHNYHECFFLLSLSLLLPVSLHCMVHILFWWSNPELWWGCWDPSVHRPPSAAKTTIFCWLNSIKHEFRVVVLKWGIPKTMGFNEFRMIWGPWRMFCSKRGPPVINWWIRPSANMLYHKPVSGGLTLLLPFTSRIFSHQQSDLGDNFSDLDMAINRCWISIFAASNSNFFLHEVALLIPLIRCLDTPF